MLYNFTNLERETYPGGNAMSTLPYWDHNVDLRIVSWFPIGLDYKPVSINAFHSKELETVASLAFCLDSELFCLTSLQSGYVGSLLRDNMLVPGKDVKIDLGFTMVLGYSRPMEKVLVPLLDEASGIQGGVTNCTLWNDDLLLESFKAIILVSVNPLFNEDAFIRLLSDRIRSVSRDLSSMPFFAEKFGYTRFFIPFETDDLTSLQISRYLYEMEFDETRRSVGPSPEKDLPNVIGLMIREEE